MAAEDTSVSLDPFDTLVTPCLPRAHRVAYLITHDRHLAADAVQEALVRAYRSLTNLKLSSPFYPWFTRIVVNEALKLAQRQARSFEPLLARMRNTPSPSLHELPEPAAESREEHECIWNMIQRLSPPHRVVIVLRYYEELSELEMANILDVPSGTVKSRLYHARKSLEQMLRSCPYPLEFSTAWRGGDSHG